MLARRWTVLVALALLAGACDAPVGTPTTLPTALTRPHATTAASTTTGRVAAEPTSTTVPPTTTTMPSSGVVVLPWTDDVSPGAPPIIVSSHEAAFLMSSGELPIRLTDGRVALAIDDGAGGLLFQKDRGRVWDPTSPRDTRIWWVPSGSGKVIDVLVPTPGAGHELSLHDVIFDDGHRIIYTRHEGVYTEGDNPFDLADRLRVFDASSGTITDLLVHGAYEAALGEVSCSDRGTVSATSYGQVDSRCLFMRLDGHTVDVPAVIDDQLCESDCLRSCALGGDGGWLAYAHTPYTERWSDAVSFVEVVDSATGAPIASRQLPEASWSLDQIDLAGSWVLVSFGDDRPAFLFHVDAGLQLYELPFAGPARFLQAPLDVEMPIEVLR